MYNVKELAKAALEARKSSYSPYSHFAVGAALVTQTGKIYTGGNIENAAYSVTNCAERTALFKAVSEGERAVVAIAVAGGPKDGALPLELCTPCGVCRQALFEFGGPEMEIVLVQDENNYTVKKLDELLPMGFGPANLAE